MMTGGNIAAEFHAAAIDRLEAPFLLDGKRTWTCLLYTSDAADD